MNLVPIKFLTSYKSYNAGEVAGFNKKLAGNMVAKGVGKYYIEGEEEILVEETKEPKSPEALVMLDVENLMEGKVVEIKKELDTLTSDGSYLYDYDYMEKALDFESLNTGREGLMNHLMEEMEKRNASTK